MRGGIEVDRRITVSQVELDAHRFAWGICNFRRTNPDVTQLALQVFIDRRSGKITDSLPRDGKRDVFTTSGGQQLRNVKVSA